MSMQTVQSNLEITTPPPPPHTHTKKKKKKNLDSSFLVYIIISTEGSIAFAIYLSYEVVTVYLW